MRNADLNQSLVDTPRSPRWIGRYELQERLGVGGMGEVWMARHTTLGATKIVAVKLLAEGLASKPQYRKMFLDEARLSMWLSHSNIVQVFDAGETPTGEFFMAMEWVDGFNLATLATALQERGEKLPHEVAVHIIREVLRGLAYAHGLRHEGSDATIVHRDVSPQNVMLSVSGEVKLMDFGIARLASEDTSGLYVKGKLRYMPPEQLRGQSREPGVDLFAVGAMFHELLDGAKFRSEAVDDQHLFAMAMEGLVPYLDARELPPQLERVRAGLLESAAEDRITSAKLALELLDQWPGNTHASVALGRIVGRFLGVDGPRTSTVTASLHLDATSRIAHEFTGVTTVEPPLHGSRESSATELGLAPPAISVRKTRVVNVGLVTLGVLAVVGFVGVLARPNETVESVETSPPAARFDGDERLEIGPPPVEDLPIEPPPAPVAIAVSDEVPLPTPASKPVIEFSAGKHDAVVVRVRGGRECRPAPDCTVTTQPGTRKLELSPAHPNGYREWQLIRGHHVEAGKCYKVELALDLSRTKVLEVRCQK